MKIGEVWRMKIHVENKIADKMANSPKAETNPLMRNAKELLTTIYFEITNIVDETIHLRAFSLALARNDRETTMDREKFVKLMEKVADSSSDFMAQMNGIIP
jgi:hypothetical protein